MAIKPVNHEGNVSVINVPEDYDSIKDKLEAKIRSKGYMKGLDHCLQLCKKLDRSLYEVICEIERAIDYNELAEVFASHAGLEKLDTIKGEIIQTQRHFIETTEGIFIWHYASLKTMKTNEKPVYILPRDSIQSYLTTTPYDTVEVLQSSSRDWFIQTIFMPAVKLGATDIHIIPNETAGTYRVDFRILGDLRNITSLTKKRGQSVVSLLLYWAKDHTPSIRIDDYRRPQDGRIEIPKEKTGVPIDLRLSFIPKQNRKDMDIVIRLLYKIELQHESISSLGFLPSQAEILVKSTERNKGIVIISGATGTGKSRTVNTLLSSMPSERNILTVEDPVEYILHNARQFQTFEWEGSDERSKKVDFEYFARAFKRHDPDVIFIGELRDKATADVAFHLSKTGHLVFATLHASRASMIPEILVRDYGINIDSVSDNLLLGVNQVLVKKICPKCSEKKRLTHLPEWTKLLRYPNRDELIGGLIGKELRFLPTASNHNAATCSCTLRNEGVILSTGYSSRTVVAECIVFDPSMFEDGNISVTAIEKKTAVFGTILNDAVEKISRGILDILSLKRLL